ncbi:hypothetical protein, partial [Burkholderia sp. ABCPW 14]|uniref:hypothetical protein n=1 Tax=Burkholderia sp. ABCPW 14 TaxID=1637860 RepID=UPI001E516E8E
PAILNDDANASRQRGPRWAPSYLSELLSIAPPFKCGFTSPSTQTPDEAYFATLPAIKSAA